MTTGPAHREPTPPRATESVAPTRSLDRVEVQHLLDVRLDDQLDAAILLHLVLRLRLHAARLGIRLAVAGRGPVTRVEPAALRGRRDEEQEHLARARERETPVVLERAAAR